MSLDDFQDAINKRLISVESTPLLKSMFNTLKPSQVDFTYISNLITVDNRYNPDIYPALYSPFYELKGIPFSNN